MLNILVIGRNMVQKDPGVIVGPIASVLGYIINFIFDLAYSILPEGNYSLALSIILFTVVMKLLMVPLSVRSHKSMMVMQKLQPEMEKIKAKYPGANTNKEEQNKMNAEVQAMYAKNKANPISGCLPLFIQFPVFMAMYYIMNQPYRFINKVSEAYGLLADKIMEIPGFFELLKPIGFSKVPKGMSLDLLVKDDLIKLLNKFVAEDWNTFLAGAPSEYAGGIQEALNYKYGIERFFSIGLTENTGLYWPAIMIPALSLITSFGLSYISSKQQKSNDPNMVMQQRLMLVVMPVMMGFVTLGIPAGVGLYWIVSNLCQIVQQVVLQRMYKDKI